MINEDNLIHELKNKNIKALDYFIDNYSDLILRVSYSVLKNRELSEECVNEVIWKVWKDIRKLKNKEEKFKKWVIVTAKYTAVDILRKEIKHNNTISIENAKYVQAETLESKFEEKELTHIIKKEIDNMSEKNKEIFERRFFKGDSVKKIGKELGMSESSISNRILREKKKIVFLIKGGIER